jgi:protein-S-isoprenylcysteine O-methyltransferase Ste14
MRSLRKRLRPRLLVVYALAAVLVWLASPTPVSLLGGTVLVGAGIALRLWATGYLFKNDELTVAGPYAYVRHPLYLGTLLIGTGLAVMAASPPAWGIYAIFLLGYFGYYLPYKDRIEGARLQEAFGDTYCRYAVAVPRLLPRLHPYQPLRGDATGTSQWSRERFGDNHEVGTSLAALVGVLAICARWALLQG